MLKGARQHPSDASHSCHSFVQLIGLSASCKLGFPLCELSSRFCLLMGTRCPVASKGHAVNIAVKVDKVLHSGDGATHRPHFMLSTIYERLALTHMSQSIEVMPLLIAPGPSSRPLLPHSLTQR